MISENKIDALVGEMFANLTFAKHPAGLYDPLRYMIEIGGKHIRPKLFLTTYSLFCDELNPQIFQPAIGLEVFHSFTLMHDDIMDRSPLRRGCETVWKKWNEDTAILSGDAMLIDAYGRIARTPQPYHPKVLDVFTTTAAQVCEGQQLDMEFEHQGQVQMSEYEQMIGLKTACLLACSAKMGALVGGATSEQCDALYQYGYMLGMAFQVADDYLDAFGDEKVFGKPIGGDIINCKKSWLTVRAMQKTDNLQELLSLLSKPCNTPQEMAAKISEVKSIYVALGVDTDAIAAVESYSKKAMDALSGLALSHVKSETLRRFVDNLVGRAR